MFDVAKPSRLTRALRRGRWPMTGALLLALLASSWVLVGVISGAAWWWLLVGFGALLLVAPAILRTLGVPRLLATVLDLVLLWVVFDAAYGAPLLGLIPTPDGLAGMAGMVGQAAEAVQREAVPATPRPELLFLVAGVGGLVAVLLDLAGATVPALVGVILAGVVAVPGIFVPEGVDLVALVGLVVAYLVVLAADGSIRLRSRAPGVAAAVIAGSTCVALAGALLAPVQESWWRDPDAHLTSKSASSLVDLARDLQQSSSSEVLRYTTNRVPTPYLQLATLDDYDGTTWVHRAGPQLDVAAVPELGPNPPGLAPTVPTDAYDTTIRIEGLDAEWAPAPYPARSVSGQAGRWTYDANDLSLSIDGAGLGSQDYTVRAVDVEPRDSDLERYRGAIDATLAGELEADTRLPDLPPIILDTARQVTAGQTSPIGIARALQAYFREDGRFRYSIDTPDEDAEDGMQVVASFLDRKSGYCIHFASAMTVMARALGIPARIAIGYLPGDRKVDPNGDVYYAETNQKLHAWSQLFFPGVGWLDFEPTVSLGAPRDYSFEPGTAPLSSTPTASSAPVAVPSSTPEDEPSTSAEAQDPARTPETAAAITARTAGWSAVAVLVLALLVAPAAIRALRRRARLRRLASTGPPALAWAEVLDTARDIGIPVDPAETPRAFAARIAEDWPPGARAELDALVLDVEHATFAPAGTPATGSDLAALTRAAIREIESSGGRGARTLARLLPRSLLAALPTWASRAASG